MTAGRWKFVISAPVALNWKPGVMNSSVRPSSGPGRSPNTVSSTRTDVVPTATTRRPSRSAAAIRSASGSATA